MIFKNKKWFSFLVVFLGVLLSIFILRSDDDPSKASVVDLFNIEDSEAALLELAPDRGGVAHDGVGESQESFGIRSNLTENLGKAVARETLLSNVDGSQLVDEQGRLVLPSADSVIQNAFSGSSLQELDLPLFTEEDIRVSEDDSVESQVRYLEELGVTFQKNFVELDTSTSQALNRFLVHQDPGPLERYLSIIPKHVSDLLALAVPSVLSEIHLRNLNTWQKRLVALKAMAGFEADPLEAVLASEYLEEAKNETEVLKATLDEYLRIIFPS